LSTDAPICIEPDLASRLPPYLLTYITEEQLCRAADTMGVDRWIFCAILDRESLGGTSTDLRPGPGPSGTGDFGPRNPHGKYGSALPPDGLGWGRGLFQKDFGAVGSSARAWCLVKLPDGRYQWEDPQLAALEAARELSAARAHFGGDDIAMIASYNAGGTDAKGEQDYHQVAPIIASLPHGASLSQKVAALDVITTNNYVSDVLRRRDGYLKAGPG
jgi:hypothetical protein